MHVEPVDTEGLTCYAILYKGSEHSVDFLVDTGMAEAPHMLRDNCNLI